MKAASLAVLSLVTAAHTALAQAKPPAAATIISAPADTKWMALRAEQWQGSAAKLSGKYVEVYGGMSTQLMVSRTSSFSNTGWLSDSAGKQVGSVLFDQAADDVIAWMHKVKCNEKCQNVFIRGIVVVRDGSKPVLRVIEAAYASKTGAAAAGSVALNFSAKDPDAKKPLLPVGGVPNKDATGPWANDAPAGAPAPDAVKKGGLLGKLKSVGVTVGKPDSKKPDASPKIGIFHFGDPEITQTYYRNIRDTELFGIFANSAWNGGNTMYPRVALIAEEVPENHSHSFKRPTWAEEVKNACWRFHAKIWTGPGASRDVAPFNWCLTEMHYDTIKVPGNPPTELIGPNNRDLALWARTPKPLFSDQNTGPEGTEGPNPPYIPTVRFHYDDDSQSETIMLASLMRAMSFKWVVGDGRVWVVQEGRRQ